MALFNTIGNVWDEPPTIPAMSIKAKVIAPTTINSVPASVGSLVEVDEQTFANLSRKGRLEVTSEAPDDSAEHDSGDTAEKKSKKGHHKKGE